MFGKLVVVVLTIGACACTLLSLRQARLQAAHELTRAQLRVRVADDQLWAMRAEIGRRVMPDQIRHMASALGSFRPMLPLPGDVERRSDYARLDPPVEAEIIPRPAAGPELSTVRQTLSPPGTKPAIHTVADGSRSTAPQPHKPAGKAQASKPTAKPSPKADLKTDPKTDTKTDSKPVARSAAKNAKPSKPDRKQALADRPERDP